MPEDKNILQVIGSILQRWDSSRKKKGRKDIFKQQTDGRVQRGLESKLRNPQSTLTKKEGKLLDTMLKRDQIVDRTDEGALTDIRGRFPGSI